MENSRVYGSKFKSFDRISNVLLINIFDFALKCQPFLPQTLPKVPMKYQPFSF
ncbi:MAG: hypothetical protein LBR17_00260 [Bacteroidales bacterium]|nr:hypothetical protein [Bacteroidales bacterium]